MHAWSKVKFACSWWIPTCATTHVQSFHCPLYIVFWRVHQQCQDLELLKKKYPSKSTTEVNEAFQVGYGGCFSWWSTQFETVHSIHTLYCLFCYGLAGVHFPYINLHTDSGFGECPYMTFSHTQTHPIKTAARDRTLFSIFMSQIHTTWDSGNDEKCTQSHVHVCCSFKGKFCWECAVSSFLFCSQYSAGFVLAVTGVFFVISFI